MKQLVRMEGNIFQGINFGPGMLAHIYPGGTLTIEQVEAGNGRWIFSKFVERITVRALIWSRLATSKPMSRPPPFSLYPR